MSFDYNTNCYNNNNDDSLIANELKEKEYSYQLNNSEQNGLHQQVSFEESNNDNNNYSKRKNKRTIPTEPCYFQQLSVEIITHVFARLDPTSLATVAKVCRHWRYIATDDACWKSAFLAFFGSFPFKRLRKDSWKSEYILRTHLIRKWEKGRGTVIQFNPKIGSIHSVSVDLENAYMMVASAERGQAVKCNPTTGSVDRHILYSTDDGVPLRVNAVKVEGQRILWGFDAGYITMTNRPKSVVGRQLRVFADFHQGAVTALALPPFITDVVLSAGEDGAVKIWDVPTVTCAKSFVGIVDTPTCLEVTRDYRILAGYSNGTVVVWNLRVDHLVKEFREQLRRRRAVLNGAAATVAEATVTEPAPSIDISESRRVIEPITIESSTPVQSIKHDIESDTMLVTHSGSLEIRKYKMSTGELLGIYGGGHDIGTITCMEWDVTPNTDTGSLQATMKMRMKKLGLTSPDSPSTPTTTAKNVSSLFQTMTRLLVTGDSVGTICVWDGDAMCTDGGKIKPLRVLHGHMAPISALFVDSFKIVSGSDDGWIRIWDPITGSLLNVLGNKIPKNAPVDRNDVSVMRVTNIHCDDYRGVATIGHQVKTWDFSPEKQILAKRNLKRNVRIPGGGDSRQLHYEIKQEWKESAEALKQERQERDEEAKELNKLTLGGLSDEEMLAYAMMLSQEEKGEEEYDSHIITMMEREEEEGEREGDSSSNTSTTTKKSDNSQKTSITTIPTSDYIDEDDEELMMAMIASMETASITPQQQQQQQQHTNTTSSSSNSSVALSDDTTEWPSVSDGNESRKWQKSSVRPTRNTSATIWNGVNTQARVIDKAPMSTNNINNTNNDEEDDEELQYVLRMSQKDF